MIVMTPKPAVSYSLEWLLASQLVLMSNHCTCYNDPEAEACPACENYTREQAFLATRNLRWHAVVIRNENKDNRGILVAVYRSYRVAVRAAYGLDAHLQAPDRIYVEETACQSSYDATDQIIEAWADPVSLPRAVLGLT